MILIANTSSSADQRLGILQPSSYLMYQWPYKVLLFFIDEETKFANVTQTGSSSKLGFKLRLILP